MKKQLLKMLSACLPVGMTCLPIGMAFIVTAIMFSASAKAQIVYTDVTPDSTFTITSLASQHYNLDINGDGTTDFSINAGRASFLGSTTSSVSITPQGSNAFITTTFNTVKKLVVGDTISSSQVWHDTTLQILKSYNQYGFDPPRSRGEWNTVVDGYVGLQFINAGQTYYGWVRMDVDVSITSASMTIKDYAYNTIPNQPILAGNTGSGSTGIIENYFASSINIFPNPAGNHVTIALGNNSKKVQVTIADINGKIIYSTTAYDPDSPDSYRDQEQKIEVNTEGFAAGIYFVRIQTADFMQTKKIVIEK